MTTPVIIDVIMAVVLIAAVIYGAHRGLFRALAGLAVVMVLSYTVAPDTPWNQVLGGVLAVFLVSGIPAFLLLMVFFICRSGRRRKKQLEKMNVQDL